MSAASTVPAPNAFLRHAVATLAYRAGKTIRGAPPHFADFVASPGTRTPAQILAHMGDLLDWAGSLANGAETWHTSTPLPWHEEGERFFGALVTFDRRLASDAPLGCTSEQLFAGPIADALTHSGQLGMLRRMAGSPVRGENYSVARIETGRTGADQPAPVYEFE